MYAREKRAQNVDRAGKDESVLDMWGMFVIMTLNEWRTE